MSTNTVIEATVISADSFGQLVRVDADPVRQEVKRAIAGFLVGYSGQTMTSYRDLDQNRGHRTLFVHRKGGKTATIPLAPRSARALDLYIDESGWAGSR